MSRTRLVLCLAQMGNALAIRSDRFLLTQLGIFTNPLLLGAVLLTFALQMAVVYVPFLQRAFSTQALTPRQLLISLALSSIVFIAVEITKWVRQRMSAHLAPR